MHFASSLSVGLRSTEPSGHTTSGRSSGRRRVALDERLRVLVGRGIEELVRVCRCGSGNLRSRTTSGDDGAPISTGPPAPVSMSATRRRISARMIFSPSAASAISSARSCSGAISSVSTSPTAIAVDERGLARELADLRREAARAVLDDRHFVAEPVVARRRASLPTARRTCPGSACRSRTGARRRRSGAPRRSGACARSRRP